MTLVSPECTEGDGNLSDKLEQYAAKKTKGTRFMGTGQPTYTAVLRVLLTAGCHWCRLNVYGL